MRHGRSRLEREAGAEHEAAVGCRACGHLAAVDLDAFADADEAVAEAVARRGADAVVAYLDAQLVGPVADGHVGPARARVLERVRQALLDDAVRGEVDRAREREALALDVQVDGQAGAADLVHQRVEAVEPRLGGELGVVAVARAWRRGGGASRRAPCGRPPRRA